MRNARARQTARIAVDRPGFEVLLIERRRSHVDRLTRVLRDRKDVDFEVVHVDSLDAALHYLQGASPDAILLGLSWPDAAPLAACAKIFAPAPGPAVIVMGPSTSEDLLIRAVHQGARDYLLLDRLHSTVLSRTIRHAIEQCRSEEARRESEAFYRSLFEESLDAILLTSLEGQILDANPAFLELSGYTEDELLRLPVAALYPKAPDRPKFLKQIEASGPIRDVVRGLRRRDGQVVECLVTVTCRRAADGAPIGFQTIARDLTPSKRLESELAESLSREREARAVAEEARDRAVSILSSISDAFMSLDREWRLVYINEAARPFVESHLDVDAESLIGQVLWEVIPGLRGTTFETEYRRVMRDGVPTQFEAHFSEWDAWFDVRAYPSSDGISIYFQEISERKEAESILRASEQQHRLLFEANPSPMWVYDPHTLQFLDVNEAAVQHYGFSREEFLSISLRDVRPPEEGPHLDEALQASLDGGRHTHTARHLARDGRVMDVLVTGGAILFHGRAARLVAVVDVTERVEAELAQRESEERFRQLAESIREVFWLVEVDPLDPSNARILYASPSYEDIWGRSRESLYSDAWSGMRDVVPEDHGRVVAAFERSGRGEAAEVEYRITRADDEVRWLWTREFPVRNEQGQVYRIAGVTEDITERKKLEEKLLRAQRLEAVGQLTGGIAHDFSNLLSVIQGNAELMELALPEEAPLREDTREIIHAARRAETLIRQLLAFSRKQVLQPKVFDLNMLIAEVEGMFSRVLRADIEMSTVLDGSLAAVEADPGQIHQMLVNLVVNARDAMPQGGRLTIETNNAEITAAEAAQYPYKVLPGSYIKLSVGDTGIGMTEDVQGQVFEPFFTTKEPGAGTGLGLSTVYGIVKQSGGYIWIRSAVGVGTTFDVYLPSARQSVSPEVQPVVSTSGGGSEVILVVEDDRALRTLLRKVLERTGHAVLEAADGHEALEVVERHSGPLHLVIADIVMPRMGGRELVEDLVHRYPDLEVIFISGYAEAELQKKKELPERSHFIHKPVMPDVLLAKIWEIFVGDRPVPEKTV